MMSMNTRLFCELWIDFLIGQILPGCAFWFISAKIEVTVDIFSRTKNDQRLSIYFHKIQFAGVIKICKKISSKY